MPFRIVLHGRLTLSPKCQEWAGHCWPALVCRYVYFYILLIGYCPSKMSVSVKPSFFLLQTTGSLSYARSTAAPLCRAPVSKLELLRFFHEFDLGWHTDCSSLQGWLGTTSAVSAAADNSAVRPFIELSSDPELNSKAKRPRKMVCFRKQN